MVRPHRIQILAGRNASRAEGQVNAAAGSVVRTTYVGDIFQYDVDIGPAILHVERPTAAGPQPFGPGTEVELEWSALDTLVFREVA